MKKVLLTITMVLAATAMFAQTFTNNGKPGKEEYKREVTKEFELKGKHPKLFIQNMYGNVNIVEGKDGKISFKIEITTKCNSKEKAEEYGESIDFTYNTYGDSIATQTRFRKKTYENCGITVNYTVTVPKNTKMEFELMYGDLILKETAEPLKAKIMYGDIKTTKLAKTDLNIMYGNIIADNVDNLKIKIMYGDIKVENINYGDIDIMYGNFINTKSNELNIKSMYSDLRLDDIKSISTSTMYDKYTCTTAGNISIRKCMYSDIKVEQLINSFVCDGKMLYSHIFIFNISKSFSEITMDASFSDISVALTKDHNFKAAIRAKDGEFRSNGIVLNDGDPTFQQRRIGTVGSSNAKATVTISNSNGDIWFSLPTKR
jgi:hypothetical protein